MCLHDKEKDTDGRIIKYNAQELSYLLQGMFQYF